MTIVRRSINALGRGLRNGLVALGALALTGSAIAIADYSATQGSGTNFASLVISSVHHSVFVLCDATLGEARCGTITSANAVKVDGSAATQPVSAASWPLPTGAATQTTLASILTALGSPFQAGGSIGNTSFGATTLSNYNGTGSTAHSAVTTAYVAGELFANNTSGNAAASTVTVTGTNSGKGLIWHAMIQSSGTTQPPEIDLWLYSAAPTTTSLVDRSPYIGPYAADITSGIFIGKLTCVSWNKTNDGTAQYFSECQSSNGVFGPLPFQALSGATTIDVLEEINGAYTPLSGETHTYLLSTSRDN